MTSTLEIQQLNASRLFTKLNDLVRESTVLNWGEYFRFLDYQKSRTLTVSKCVEIRDKLPRQKPLVKQRKVFVMASNAAEGNGGYIAFAYDVNSRDGKVTLVKLTIACQDTGRVEHANITPTIASTQGILKTLTKKIPRMVNQFVELMHRIR